LIRGELNEEQRVHPLLRTVLQRLALGLLTLWVVSLIVFAMVEMLPGNFAQAVLGQSATPEVIENFNKRAGLDRPVLERYAEWMAGAVQGDFGVTFSSLSNTGGTVRTVASVIGPRLANTLFLGATVAIIAVPLALILGLLAALYRNGVFDRLVNLTTLTSISVPEFLVGYILMLFLAVRNPWFYSLATVDSETSFWQHIARIGLPVLTLVLVIVAHMMRMTRAAIINLLSSPFVEMARLKGMPPSRVIWHHALPNAWAPIANVIALNLAYLVVGVVVVEGVFACPGIGHLMVTAVLSRDIPVVQACAIIFALVYILLNLLADIVSIATNPRLLHPR
jgi:peptide/nickel transport system permease protein